MITESPGGPAGRGTLGRSARLRRSWRGRGRRGPPAPARCCEEKGI